MFTAANFLKTRQRTETIVSLLKIEYFSAQPIVDVSPPVGLQPKVNFLG